MQQRLYFLKHPVEYVLFLISLRLFGIESIKENNFIATILPVAKVKDLLNHVVKEEHTPNLTLTQSKIATINLDQRIFKKEFRLLEGIHFFINFKHSLAVRILKGRFFERERKCLFSVTNASAPTYSVYAAINASAGFNPKDSYFISSSKGRKISSSIVALKWISFINSIQPLGVKFLNKEGGILSSSEKFQEKDVNDGGVLACNALFPTRQISLQTRLIVRKSTELQYPYYLSSLFLGQIQIPKIINTIIVNTKNSLVNFGSSIKNLLAKADAIIIKMIFAINRAIYSLLLVVKKIFINLSSLSSGISVVKEVIFRVNGREVVNIEGLVRKDIKEVVLDMRRDGGIRDEGIANTTEEDGIGGIKTGEAKLKEEARNIGDKKDDREIRHSRRIFRLLRDRLKITIELESKIAEWVLYPSIIKRVSQEELHSLFSPSHIWGVYLFKEREEMPEILDEEERDYYKWVRNRIEKYLNSIEGIGFSFSKKEKEEIISCVFEIYKFKLKEGKEIKEIISNNEWNREVTSRIINLILKGNPDDSFYVFKEFNEYGRKLALKVIRDVGIKVKDIKSLMKLSVAVGIAGLKVKREMAIIGDYGKDRDEYVYDIKEEGKMLRKKMREEFKIDFWENFEKEIIENERGITLVWITDDYIESIIDLYFIQRILTINKKLKVALIPRKGRWENDFNYEDAKEMIGEKVFEELKKYCIEGRFRVVKEGIVGEGLSDKNISKEAFETIKKGDYLFVKGAEGFERLAGMNKIVYFAFVVSGSYSESTTGLSSKRKPMVFIRQSPGEQIFEDFKARSHRRIDFLGETIKISGKTAIEYVIEKGKEEFLNLEKGEVESYRKTFHLRKRCEDGYQKFPSERDGGDKLDDASILSKLEKTSLKNKFSDDVDVSDLSPTIQELLKDKFLRILRLLFQSSFMNNKIIIQKDISVRLGAIISIPASSSMFYVYVDGKTIRELYLFSSHSLNMQGLEGFLRDKQKLSQRFLGYSVNLERHLNGEDWRFLDKSFSLGERERNIYGIYLGREKYPSGFHHQTEIFALDGGKITLGVSEIEELTKTLPKDKKYFILLHSHYDPAWFGRRKVTRSLLPSYFEKVFFLLDKHPQYKFIFDCQTQVIEDCLSCFKPQEREKIEEKLKKYIKEARLVIGPYYAGIDWNLSGSALLRKNLLYGIKDARRLGWNKEFVGWLIDQFGFPAQTWQIHKGFDIDSTFLRRGLGVRPEEVNTEVVLVSPDGTEILGKWLFIQGYYFGMYLGNYKEIALPRLILEGEKISPYTESNNILIMDGYEGEPEPDNPVELVEEVRKKRRKAFISTPQEYLEKIKRDVEIDDLPRLEGPQDYGIYSPVLKGVVSSRQYLKQAHQVCDEMLTKWIAPFAYILHLLGVNQNWEEIEKLWRDLIRQASHDELGGCGIDDIHRDSMEVYKRIFKQTNQLLERNLKILARNVDTTRFGKNVLPIVIVNPSPWRRRTYFRVIVEIPSNWKNFVILDVKGNRVSRQLIKKEGTKVEMIIFPSRNIPPLGYSTFYILPQFQGDNSSYYKPSLKVGKNWMENEFIKVKINSDGTFDLIDKINQKEYRNMGYFKIEPDRGDTYDYSHVREPSIIETKGRPARITREVKGSLFARFKIEQVLDVPVGLDETRDRWGEEKKKLSITTYLELAKSSSRIDLEVKVDNTTKDHRIRICFPTDFLTDHLDVAQQYDVATVDIRGKYLSPEERERISRMIKGMVFTGMDLVPVRNHINFQFADLSNGRLGLAFINKSNFECEVTIDNQRNRIFELTLLRGVGWNSRGDLLTRDLSAGWEIYTPDAQCLGKYNFYLALLPHKGNWREAEVGKWAEDRNLSLKVVQTKPSAGRLPDSFSFLELKSKRIMISEITKADKGDDLIIVLYNPGRRLSRGELTLSDKIEVEEVYKAKLSEEKEERLEIKGRTLIFNILPKQICTLRLKLKSSLSIKEKLPIYAQVLEPRLTLGDYVPLERKPEVSVDDLKKERERWKKLEENFKILKRELSRRGRRLKQKLEDVRDYCERRKRLIDLATLVKEAHYSYLLTLKRFWEQENRKEKITQVEKKIALMAKDLITLRVKKRMATITYLFFENLKKWKDEKKPEEEFNKTIKGSLKKIKKLGKIDIVVGIPFANEKETAGKLVEAIAKYLSQLYPHKKSLIVCVGEKESRDTLGVIKSISFPQNVICLSFLKGADSLRGKGWSVRIMAEFAKELRADLYLFDANLKGLSWEWFKSFTRTLTEEKVDLVIPQYSNNYSEDLISRFFLYPLLGVLYRVLIPFPIPREFGISYRLLDIYLNNKEIWTTEVGRYGINLWLLTEAIVNEARICKVFVGRSKHISTPGKANLKLRDVIKTAFEEIGKNSHWWQKKGDLIYELPFCSLEFKDTFSVSKVDYSPWISRYRRGFNRYTPLYRRLLPPQMYIQLTNIASQDIKDFDFPERLWAEIVFEFLFAFQWRREFAREDLVDAFLPLFEGRAASFIKNIEGKRKELLQRKVGSKETREILRSEAKRLIMKQLDEFQKKRGQFLRRWEKGNLSPVVVSHKAVVTELFIPDLFLVIPEKITTSEGKVVETKQIKDEMLEEYKNKFEEFVFKRLHISSEADSEMITKKIREFIFHLEKGLSRYLLSGNLYIVEGTKKSVNKIFRYFPHTKCLSLRSEVIRNFLVRNPPPNLITKLGCKDLDSLFRFYEPKEIFSLVWWTEKRDYIENIWQWIADSISPRDFERKSIRPVIVNYQLFPELAEARESSPLDKLSGRIIICNLPKGRGEDFPKLHYFITISKSIVETERFSKIWSMFAKDRRNFGKKVVNSLGNQWRRSPLSSYTIFESGHQKVLVSRLRKMAHRIREKAEKKKDERGIGLAESLEDMAFSYHLALRRSDGKVVPCSAWSWANYSFKGGKDVPTPFFLSVERDRALCRFLEKLLIAADLGDAHTLEQTAIRLIGEGNGREDLAHFLLGLPKEEIEKNLRKKDGGTFLDISFLKEITFDLPLAKKNYFPHIKLYLEDKKEENLPLTEISLLIRKKFSNEVEEPNSLIGFTIDFSLYCCRMSVDVNSEFELLAGSSNFPLKSLNPLVNTVNPLVNTINLLVKPSDFHLNLFFHPFKVRGSLHSPTLNFLFQSLKVREGRDRFNKVGNQRKYYNFLFPGVKNVLFFNSSFSLFSKSFVVTRGEEVDEIKENTEGIQEELSLKGKKEDGGKGNSEGSNKSESRCWFDKRGREFFFLLGLIRVVYRLVQEKQILDNDKSATFYSFKRFVIENKGVRLFSSEGRRENFELREYLARLWHAPPKESDKEAKAVSFCGLTEFPSTYFLPSLKRRETLFSGVFPSLIFPYELWLLYFSGFICLPILPPSIRGLRRILSIPLERFASIFRNNKDMPGRNSLLRWESFCMMGNITHFSILSQFDGGGLNLKVKSILIFISFLASVYQFSLKLFPQTFADRVFPYGIDFLTYAIGPKLFDLGLNPYLKENIGLIKNLPEVTTKILNDPITLGYVGTPVSAIVFYPFSLLLNLGADIAIAIFDIFSIAVFIGLFSLFIIRAIKIDSFINKLLVISLVSFIVTSFPPLTWSVFFLGQIEAVYLSPLLLGIYFATSKDSKLIYLASFLIALSGGIKLFPAIISLYFFYKNLLYISSMEKRDWKTYFSHPSSKMTVGLLVNFIFLFAISIVFTELKGFSFFYFLMSFIHRLKLELTLPPEAVSLWNFLPLDILRILGIGGVVFLAIKRINALYSEKRIVLESAMVLTLLPLMMFHWKAYYNVVMLFPLLIALIYTQEIKKKRKRLLLNAGIIFSFFFIGSAFAPHVVPWLFNFPLLSSGIDNLNFYLGFFFLMALPATFVLLGVIRILLKELRFETEGERPQGPLEKRKEIKAVHLDSEEKELFSFDGGSLYQERIEDGKLSQVYIKYKDKGFPYVLSKDGGKPTIALVNKINKNNQNRENDGGPDKESNNSFKDEKNRDEGRKQAQKYIKDGLIATFAGFGLLEIAFLLPDYFYVFTILNLLYPLCFPSRIILISAGLFSFWVGLTIDKEREEFIEERKDGENDDGRKDKLTSQKVGIINKLLQDGGKKKEEKKEFVFTRERISKEEALRIIKDELSLLLSSLNIEGEEKNSIIESSLRKTIINTTRFEAILNTCRLFPKVILLLLLKDKVAAALIILGLIIWFASKIPPSSATGPSLWDLCIALCILLISCLRIPFNLGATLIGDFIFINTYYPKVNSEKAIGFIFIHEFIHQKGREVFGLTEEDGRLVANALTYLYLSEGREEEIIDMFIYSCKSFRYWTENDKKVFKKKIEESMREEFIPEVVIERIKKEPGISRRFKMQLKFGHLSGDEYAFPMELMAALWAIKALSAYQSGGIPSALKMLLNNLSTQSKEADILNSQKDGGEYNTKSTILLNEINKNSKNGKNDGGLSNEKSNNPFKDRDSKFTQSLFDRASKLSQSLLNLYFQLSHSSFKFTLCSFQCSIFSFFFHFIEEFNKSLHSFICKFFSQNRRDIDNRHNQFKCIMKELGLSKRIFALISRDGNSYSKRAIKKDVAGGEQLVEVFSSIVAADNPQFFIDEKKTLSKARASSPKLAFSSVYNPEGEECIPQDVLKEDMVAIHPDDIQEIIEEGELFAEGSDSMFWVPVGGKSSHHTDNMCQVNNLYFTNSSGIMENSPTNSNIGVNNSCERNIPGGDGGGGSNGDEETGQGSSGNEGVSVKSGVCITITVSESETLEVIIDEESGEGDILSYVRPDCRAYSLFEVLHHLLEQPVTLQEIAEKLARFPPDPSTGANTEGLLRVAEEYKIPLVRSYLSDKAFREMMTKGLCPFYDVILVEERGIIYEHIVTIEGFKNGNVYFSSNDEGKIVPFEKYIKQRKVEIDRKGISHKGVCYLFAITVQGIMEYKKKMERGFREPVKVIVPGRRNIPRRLEEHYRDGGSTQEIDHKDIRISILTQGASTREGEILLYSEQAIAEGKKTKLPFIIFQNTSLNFTPFPTDTSISYEFFPYLYMLSVISLISVLSLLYFLISQIIGYTPREITIVIISLISVMGGMVLYIIIFREVIVIIGMVRSCLGKELLRKIQVLLWRIRRMMQEVVKRILRIFAFIKIIFLEVVKRILRMFAFIKMFFFSRKAHRNCQIFT
ncbi:MAG: hypothetical protein B6D56_05650 [Candidatus Omnitrophica bacterium 4484_70.1]|nr:MAG: hypothetical protein B6D56_05650 [Candidatus Omnitrophica bacterium 4484_70.1]